MLVFIVDNRLVNLVVDRSNAARTSAAQGQTIGSAGHDTMSQQAGEAGVHIQLARSITRQPDDDHSVGRTGKDLACESRRAKPITDTRHSCREVKVPDIVLRWLIRLIKTQQDIAQRLVGLS